MPGISIHVVDVSRGLVAAGMRIELHAISESGEPTLLAHGAIGGNGLCNEPELTGIFKPGAYAALFHVGEFYRQAGVALPPVPFLDVVHFHFGITDPAQHYHLPFKCTPWGYSCFRGGA
jgi:5-hydroxyisourate hydrolase